jgi:hypothetical protein
MFRDHHSRGLGTRRLGAIAYLVGAAGFLLVATRAHSAALVVTVLAGLTFAFMGGAALASVRWLREHDIDA